MKYAHDLKALLLKGTLTEQKAFLRSFIKRVDFEPGHVAIDYSIPVPMGEGKAHNREVLSTEPAGEPSGIRTPDALIKSQGVLS